MVLTNSKTCFQSWNWHAATVFSVISSVVLHLLLIIHNIATLPFITMANRNMEACLLGGSDSSDESDSNETELYEVTTGVPAAAAIAVTVSQAPKLLPAPPAVPTRAYAPNAPASSQLSSRRKDDHSPAANNKATPRPTPMQQVPASASMRDRATRKGFVVFTQLLIQYLQHVDPTMRLKASAVIRKCAEMKANKAPGYESINQKMQHELRVTVGATHWSKAVELYKRYVKQKQGSSSSAPLQAPRPSFAKQQTRQPNSSHQETQDRLADERQKLQDVQRQESERRKQVELQRRRDQERRIAERKRKQAEMEHKKQKGFESNGPDMSLMTSNKAKMQPTHEYNELMETLDHAVDYDWTSASLLLGTEANADLKLSNEQKRLLYGTSLKPPRHGLEAAQSALLASDIPMHMQGWGKQNVISSRRAWERVRLLREEQDQSARDAQQSPVVGGLCLPSLPQKTPALVPEASCFNEEVAEQLSEATQKHLKSILQKGLVAARQRENLEGIRLWHLQHGRVKPPMSLRLGCDVNRQVAQAEGNAAKTVQRMEEALSRQPRVPAKARDLDNEETLYNASSMADLALRPKLLNAAEEADANAKRSFAVFGGKEITEAPPFGRVPKRVKLTMQDLTLVREFVDYSHQSKSTKPLW